MPEVLFVGEVEGASVQHPLVCVSWAIVPGSKAWSLNNGRSHGETQSSETCPELGWATLNHPIDASYQVTSVEGWPVFVCEVWEKFLDGGARSFVGCGSAWMPTTQGAHSVEIDLWRPCGHGLEELSRKLFTRKVHNKLQSLSLSSS